MKTHFVLANHVILVFCYIKCICMCSIIYCMFFHLLAWIGLIMRMAILGLLVRAFHLHM